MNSQGQIVYGKEIEEKSGKLSTKLFRS